MYLNNLKLFKIFLTLIFLITGIIYIIIGFEELRLDFNKLKSKKNTLNSILPQNTNKLNANIFNKKIYEKDIADKIDLIKQVIVVKQDDTLSKIIDNFLITNKLKNLIIKKLSQKIDLKNLNIGKEIFFYKNNKNQISKIIIPKNFYIDVVLNINNNEVTVIEKKLNFTKEYQSIEFLISSSLYKDGITANVPISIISDAIKLFSFDIDFQRDIQKNTKFEVMYEYFVNEKNKIQFSDIQYVKLTIKKNELEYFNFITEDSFSDYFDKEGKNVKKSILKTPIDGARLSSNYGMRKHPISGFNKLHRGVDFAAPKGTPIYAGGNGIIEYVGLNGGYGKYIRIRHNNEYKTAYAHMLNFKKGIYNGIRVNQGDIIGYVGSTGNSTGPHLHYEIIYKNKQINPMKLKLPSGKILSGSELEKFKKKANQIYSEYLFYMFE